VRIGPGRGNLRQGMLEGFEYVRGEPVVRAIILLSLVPLIFGTPYNTLVPVFARDVLQVGPEGYGFLTGAAGFGALVGAIGMAWLRRPTGRSLILGAFVFGAALVGFALSPWLPLSVLLLVVVGLSNQVFMTTANTLVQMAVPDALRGRVMSLFLMDRGLVPLGAVLAGASASVLGAPYTLAAMGAVCAGLALASSRPISRLTPVD
jgi:MFS family permease